MSYYDCLLLPVLFDSMSYCNHATRRDQQQCVSQIRPPKNDPMNDEMNFSLNLYKYDDGQ